MQVTLQDSTIITRSGGTILKADIIYGRLFAKIAIIIPSLYPVAPPIKR